MALPDIRGPIEARTPGGSRVRVRPGLALGRWIVDVWAPTGDLVLAGRPLATEADLLSIVEGLGAVLVTGDSDPIAAQSLPAQGTGLRAPVPG